MLFLYFNCLKFWLIWVLMIVGSLKFIGVFLIGIIFLVVIKVLLIGV